MARPRKSVEQHILQGTYQPVRHAARSEPRPDGDPGDPPDWLTGEGLLTWRRIVDAFRKSRVLTALDATELATYCAMYAEFVAGMRREAEPVRVSHIGTMSSLATKLGLNPAGRARLSAPLPAEEDKPADPWSQIRKGLEGVRSGDEKTGRA